MRGHGRILAGLDEGLLPALANQARTHAHSPMIGRSHGMHAEPITVGIFFAGSYAELRRGSQRLRRAGAPSRSASSPGPSGSMARARCRPPSRAAALASLGLAPETIATQVVARDRHAELLQALTLIAAAIERLA